MLRSLSRRIFLLGLGSRTLSSRTMVFSLIVRPLRDIVVNWELQIDILPQFIPKGMGKSRLLTMS